MLQPIIYNMSFLVYLKILNVYIWFPAIFTICLSDKVWQKYDKPGSGCGLWNGLSRYPANLVNLDGVVFLWEC